MPVLHIPSKTIIAPAVGAHGSKPIGPLVFDETHPSAAFHPSHGQSFQKDIYTMEVYRPVIPKGSNSPPTYTMAAVAGTPTYGVLFGRNASIFAQSATADVSLVAVDNGIYTWAESQWSPDVAGEFTWQISFLQEVASTGDEVGIASIGSPGGSNGLYIYFNKTSGDLTVAYDHWSSNKVATASAPALGVWHTLVISSYGSGNRIACFLDGRQIGDTTAGTITVSGSLNATLKLGDAFGTAYHYSIYGGISDWFYWCRAIPDMLALDISRNPYQIYKPTYPDFFVVGSAGAPPVGAASFSPIGGPLYGRMRGPF